MKLKGLWVNSMCCSVPARPAEAHRLQLGLPAVMREGGVWELWCASLVLIVASPAARHTLSSLASTG